MSDSTIARITEARYPTRPSTINEAVMLAGYNKLPQVLQQLGFTAMRKGQDAVIVNILAERDTICILPTATGKSACFIVPTLCHDWHTIVFSPLVALMRDQIQNLWKKNVRAGQMSGIQSDAENLMAARQWASGELQFLYVAPERLDNEQFKQAIAAQRPEFVVIDEAHTLSQWSDNFRPAYCKIGDFIAKEQPKVVAAFTATCPDEVEEDIRRVLGLKTATKLIHYPRRKNLQLRSTHLSNDWDVVEMVRNIRGPVIVYCATVKGVEDLTAYLGESLGEEVTMFHGQLSDDAKRTNMDLFMSDKTRVVVATNAFGMGVDKANIRGVIHYDFPGSVEALAQEVGRAGRDGLDSICMTFMREKSLSTQKWFIQTSHPPESDVRRIYQSLLGFGEKGSVCKVTGRELARIAKVHEASADAVISILKGANVIERAKSEEKLAKIKFTGAFDEERFQRYKAAIEQGGVLDRNGAFYEIDLVWLCQKLATSDTTVRNWLRQWDKEGLIKFLPPFRGTPIRVIGDLSLVDFPRLKKKADEAYEKLDKVVKYVIEVPDAEKHEYLEAYFQTGTKKK